MTKKLFAINVVLILVLCLSLTVCATSWNTYVLRVEQEKDNWCWAASAEMVARNQVSTSLRQGDAVEYLKGTEDDPRPDVAGTMVDCKNALSYIANYSFSVIRGSTPLIESALQTKISSGFPVCAGILWSAGGGHMVVLDKYTDTTSLVRVVDPWYDCTEKIEYEYDDLINGVFMGSDTGTWAEYCTRYS